MVMWLCGDSMYVYQYMYSPLNNHYMTIKILYIYIYIHIIYIYTYIIYIVMTSGGQKQCLRMGEAMGFAYPRATGHNLELYLL